MLNFALNPRNPATIVQLCYKPCKTTEGAKRATGRKMDKMRIFSNVNKSKLTCKGRI